MSRSTSPCYMATALSVSLLSLSLAACSPDGAALLAPREGGASASRSLGDGVSAAAPTAAYRAALNTLPEAQGWTYLDYYGNAQPTVSQGALIAVNTVGAQLWKRDEPTLDFSRGFAFEARIKIVSSNYLPGGGGTREGYYFAVVDSTSLYTIGIADAGFNLNSICAPNQALTPFSFADGQFHDIKFNIVGRRASLRIDGMLMASGIAPDPFTHCYHNAAGSLWFGGHAGVSRSVTELKDFVYRVR